MRELGAISGSILKRRLREGVGDGLLDMALEDSRVLMHWKVKPVGSDDWVYDTRVEHPDGVSATLSKLNTSHTTKSVNP